MRKMCLIICIAMSLSKGFAQVAINGNNAAPHASAMLDIKSYDKGLLIPRLSSVGRTGIFSPAKGLLVYDTTLSAFFYHTGLAWTQIGTGVATNFWNQSGNNIYNNNAGNVGIGTPAPAKPLDVAGNGGIQITNGSNSSSNNELYFTDNGQIRSLDNYHRIVFNRSGDQLEFHELGSILFKTGNPITEAMRVANNGRIGIGTTSPAKPLDVASAGGIRISNGANASPNNELFFSDNGQIRSLDDNHRIVFNRSADQIEFNEKGTIIFATGNPVTEVMRVDMGGHVGIGTTNTTTRLHVVDAVNSPALLVESGSSSPVIMLNNTSALGYSTSIDSRVNNVWKSSISATPQGDLVLNNNGGSMSLKENGAVGIGTSNPDASAILELGGTKGFLPPKMTQVQRDLIQSPAEGLEVYNTTTHLPNYFDGQFWWNYDGTAAGIQIGLPYQGGITAYILNLNDPGYDPNVIHGLIAAPTDQSTGAEWGCYGTLLSGAIGITLGTGNQNTTDIVSGCAATGIAARLCSDLVLNGFSDWYLPSKDELNKLYMKRVLIGGFAGFTYWSSSQVSANTAWGQDFSDGYQFSGLKNALGYVRAIRAF